jgi:hypothetical protein
VRFFIVFVVAFLLSGGLFAGKALACSCAIEAFGAAASTQNIERAKYIVEGSVSFVAPEDEVKDPKYKNLSAFGITVTKTLKGDGVTFLAAYADTKTKCGVSVEVLKRLDFFILYEGDDGQLSLANMCSSHIEPEDRIRLMHESRWRAAPAPLK